MRGLNTQENRDKGILSDTMMKMVGVAAHLNDANQRLNQLRGLDNPTSIRVEGYKGDIVHEIVGGNPETRTVNTQNKGWLQVVKEMFSNHTSSVHNCHGLGQQ